MKSILFVMVFGLLSGLFAADPVWTFVRSGSGMKLVLDVPEGMYYYPEQTYPSVFAKTGEILKPSAIPKPQSHKDSLTGKNVPVYTHGKYTWIYAVSAKKFPLKIKLPWQGCSDGKDGKPETCFLPGELETQLSADALQGTIRAKKNEIASTADQFPSYQILRRASGYLSVPEFTAFLRGEQKNSILNFTGKSFIWILLLTFFGGIALNLTPCVLPMIPVNLAIIGARSGSRVSCMMRGLIYGSGIALAYGALGLIVVLTGSGFGMLSSAWWFNALVSIIFILLGLSLFDLFLFDLSRFRSGIGKFSKAKYAGIFLMGILAALLAGACVAPVVAASLLQAGKMYNEGQIAGLFLPFVLGLGMACPWPLAAGGFAVLPKPGTWMKYVKYVFGGIIICMGLYYGGLAYETMTMNHSKKDAAQSVQMLTDALRKSAADHMPVFIDFRASWCKNCIAMEQTTFKDPAVRELLAKYHFVEFDATDMQNPQIRKILQNFNISGMPAYLILSGK